MFCRHVFGNISGGFRGFSRFFGNFAGPRPREISEALNVATNTSCHSTMFNVYNNIIINNLAWQRPYVYMYVFPHPLIRASDISRGRGPAKFRYFREIPRNSPKNAKYREIGRKYFQIHVGKTYLILFLAIRPVLFTPNVQIYLETSSLQRVKQRPKTTRRFR